MKPDKKAKTQKEEMALAARKGRQPVCIHCGHLLDRISQTKYEYITWSWNADNGYYNDAVCDSDRPYHDCLKCPGGCDAGDPDFAGNDLIYY